MDTLFKSSSTFASLSLKDLVEARDLFHYQLMNKKNVIATALGIYRIRKSDPWPKPGHPPQHERKPKDERRTLFNSEIRPYSWPCVYVFVSSWEYEASLAQDDPSDVVPKALFLPDGRAVPVCVIEARQQPYATDLRVNADLRRPRNLLGPGSALINENGQGMARLATAGCMVRDGERYYVLTNRHAVGEPGTTIKVLQNHQQPVIGESSPKGLTREKLNKVYPHLPSTNQHLLMDVGLVELDDVLAWKTDVPGIAPIGPVLDLYDNSFSLKLIAMQVVGYSAVTGPLRGEIHGLFYRYKAMGGWEYVSDFLIGPATYGEVPDLEAKTRAERRDPNINVSFAVHHGDSGTVLFIEHVDETTETHAKTIKKTIYYPFALLWGKEEFFGDGKVLSHPYALATSLSTALDQLNLDLVRDINVDQEYVWGWVGHYVIGRALSLPTDLMSSAKLRSFIAKNIGLLALQPDSALDNDPKVQTAGSSKVNFVPLADVPDNVWKSNVNFTMVAGTDGKKHHKPGPGSRGQDDNKNHFADLDLVYLGGKTFLEMNAADPDIYLNPEAWVAYFNAMKQQYDEWAKLLKQPAGQPKAHWGALPFRVHQLFDAMIAAAKQKNQALFLCAGGALIHYVGDACQPLHASYLSQGDPERVVPKPRSPGKMKLEADGVHSGYEDDMIAYGETNKDLSGKLKARIASLKSEQMPEVATGYDASKAIISLIAATHDDISPRDIVNEWVKLNGTPKKSKARAMWELFGDRTITCIARGTRYLAAIWQAAWDAGNGDANVGLGTEIGQNEIEKLYNDPNVVPSIPLDHYPADKDSDWSSITRTVTQSSSPRTGTRVIGATKKPRKRATHRKVTGRKKT